MADFLLEIGLEEVPARMLAGAKAELERRVGNLLVRERLLVSAAGATESFATPRRLAVRVRGVPAQQEDISEEVLGPSAKVAYKDGAPGPAAVAFAKKAGVTVESLKIINTPKGEYVAATSVRAGRAAAEVLAAGLPGEIAAIYWAKNMYWRAGKPERFVRPVRWIVALLGEAVVPLSFAGRAAGNISVGHRVLHGEAPVVLGDAGEYEPALAKAFVAVDVEGRRQRIRKALDRVCRTVEGARWREDHELVETVTELTEWPTVVLGAFEPQFLELPEEVLVTVMRDHQKYFAVEGAAGKLLPYFLAVLNTEPDEHGLGIIRHGNERVLRARFNDARFFWEFDQRMPLRERVGALEKVTFQRDLGSYAKKSERVQAIAGALAGELAAAATAIDTDALDEAAQLAKTDLTTDLVKEFTELQGVIGGLYARAQGVCELAAIAIYDQYRPAGMDDAIPRSVEGQVLAIADKADTIAGMFGLGMEPTGSKDPFALRRAANGVVKILAESRMPITLRQIAEAASAGDPLLTQRLLAFFAERLEFYLRDASGQAYDVVAAVLAAGREDVQDVLARAKALTSVRAAAGEGAGDFLAVSAAFKRMRNILAQAQEKAIDVPADVKESLLIEPAETALAERSADLASRVEQLRQERNYQGALESIASLRPQVDAFFDEVMVMVPEPELRGNRLALLARVLGDLSRIADFSEIVVTG